MPVLGTDRNMATRRTMVPRVRFRRMPTPYSYSLD